MNTKEIFERTMAEVNQTGNSYGFGNGINWAKKAAFMGEINQSQLEKFSFCSQLMAMMTSNSESFDIPQNIMNSANKFRECILKSQLRNIAKQQNKKKKTEPKLPNGTFRTFKPFEKEFHWKGMDAEPYNFKFSIEDEGSSGNPSFKIYIKDAPYLKEGKNDPHRFHIIPCANPYICWSDAITDFMDANAIMLTWAQNYKKELDNDKEARGVKPVRTNFKKRNVPSGRFRADIIGSESAYEEKRVFVEKKIYERIMETIGQKKPELGGMLGFLEDQDFVIDFVFDKKAKVTCAEYNPDTRFLNSVINGKWKDKGIFLAGFVHSHPGNFNRLSGADIEYAAKICREFDLDHLFMPILTNYDKEPELTGYIVTHDEIVEECTVSIIDSMELLEKQISECDEDEDVQETTVEENPVCEDDVDSAEKVGGTEKTGIPCPDSSPVPDMLSQNETFARISAVIPLDYMKNCTIVGIGCGGSRGFYEDMARCGVGKFILFDGDTSSRSNIASQNGYISEIGKNKAAVVAGRLSDINDELFVHAITRMLDDNVSDDDFEKILSIAHAVPEKTIICAFTDSFEAQARAQKLAIRFKIPFLAAQHHAFGETSEAIYWYPGITKYSQADILKDRYESYRNGFKNDVTSAGSPIFNTTRLNALCEKLAVGILLYGSGIQSRYTSFISYKPDRNLILVRQKCLDFGDSSLDALFGHGDRYHFDDVVWLNPEELVTFEDNSKLESERIVDDSRNIFG